MIQLYYNQIIWFKFIIYKYSLIKLYYYWIIWLLHAGFQDRNNSNKISLTTIFTNTCRWTKIKKMIDKFFSAGSSAILHWATRKPHRHRGTFRDPEVSPVSDIWMSSQKIASIHPCIGDLKAAHFSAFFINNLVVLILYFFSVSGMQSMHNHIIVAIYNPLFNHIIIITIFP